MKSCPNHPLLLILLVTALRSMLINQAVGQTFTVLHSFTPTSTNSFGVLTNSDGANPLAGLFLSGNTIYGTTSAGGSSGNAPVFAFNTDGTGFTTFHWPGFSILSTNTLYGAAGGGSGHSSTVFKVNTDGTGFTNLYSFSVLTCVVGAGDSLCTNSDGGDPGGFILSGDMLYGVTVVGDSSGAGTVFALKTDGTAFTTLHAFSWGNGAQPEVLLLSSNTLYGTTRFGGSGGSGTVFKINTDGSGFTNILQSSYGSGVNGVLILSGEVLYGTTGGEDTGGGTVFAVKTDGTGFTTLHAFSALSGGTNGDGAYPGDALVLSGHTLYGTTVGGGSLRWGTLFAVNTDGTGFTTLHIFTSPSYGRLVLSGDTLYGTTAWTSGTSGSGTVFSIAFTPQLTAVRSQTNLFLSWPTNYASFDYSGYNLESTTNLASPVWATNSPAPVIVNGQKSVTAPVLTKQQYFRLKQ